MLRSQGAKDARAFIPACCLAAPVHSLRDRTPDQKQTRSSPADFSVALQRARMGRPDQVTEPGATRTQRPVEHYVGLGTGILGCCRLRAFFVDASISFSFFSLPRSGGGFSAFFSFFFFLLLGTLRSVCCVRVPEFAQCDPSWRAPQFQNKFCVCCEK